MPQQNWQACVIVTGKTRVVFDWKATYKENYAEAHDYMMFNVTIAQRDGWRIVRGSL